MIKHTLKTVVNTIHHPINRAALTFLTGILFNGTASAQLDNSATEFIEPNVFDRLWARTVLYDNSLNPFIQEFKLRGRYQGQYWDVDSERGSHHDWEDRRAYFGFDVKLFDKKLEGRFDFQSDQHFTHFYDGLIDAYLRWKPKTDLSITVGKTKALLGAYEFNEVESATPTVERSQIFNQLNVNRATAMVVEGENAGILWQAGLYANDTPSTTGGTGDWGDGEFSHFNGGYAYGAGLGYNWNHELDVEKALLRLDWIHSEREVGDQVFGRYDELASLTFWLKEGNWTLIQEAYTGRGGDGLNGDVIGYYIMPVYDIVPQKLQLVARYTISDGDGPGSIIAQSRYENRTSIPAISGIKGSKNRGSAYQALYLGAQYFIYGNKLKLMTGAEWATLDRENGQDAYDGFTLMSGIRLSF